MYVLNLLCQPSVYSTDVFRTYAQKHTYGKETNINETFIINHTVTLNVNVITYF